MMAIKFIKHQIIKLTPTKILNGKDNYWTKHFQSWAIHFIPKEKTILDQGFQKIQSYRTYPSQARLIKSIKLK